MNEVFQFLKQAGVFYIATDEEGQPRVRPFGALALFEDKLYLQMGKKKKVYKQLCANGHFEICAMVGHDKWMRLCAQAVEDDRLCAREEFLRQNPNLASLYAADDGNCVVFYIKNATATFESFSGSPVVIKF